MLLYIVGVLSFLIRQVQVLPTSQKGFGRYLVFSSFNSFIRPHHSSANHFYAQGLSALSIIMSLSMYLFKRARVDVCHN
jgi:hypothetical protein